MFNVWFFGQIENMLTSRCYEEKVAKELFFCRWHQTTKLSHNLNPQMLKDIFWLKGVFVVVVLSDIFMICESFVTNVNTCAFCFSKTMPEGEL